MGLDLRLRQAALACGLLVVAIGSLTIIGWLSGYLALARVMSGYIPTAPSTALSFIILGAGLTVAAYGKTGVVRWITWAWLVAVMLLAAGVLVRLTFGFVPDIEGLWVRAPMRLGLVPVGRMSPITAVGFIVGSGGLLVLLSGRKSRVGASLAGSSLILAGLTVSLGYLYRAPLLYGSTVIPVALPTAVAFVALGAGITSAAGPDRWPLSAFVGTSVRSSLMRRFLPLFTLIIILQGYVLGLTSTRRPLPVISAATAAVAVAFVGVAVSRIGRSIGMKIERAQQELGAQQAIVNESEQKYRSLFENANDAIFLIDSGSRHILDCNNKAAEMTGYSVEQLHTMKVEQMHPREELEALSEKFESVSQTGRAANIAGLHYQRPDGSFVPVEVNAAEISLGGRKVHVSVVRDITERERAEAEIRGYLRKLEIFTSVIGDITSALDTSLVLEETVRKAVELIGGDAGTIAVYDSDRDEMTYPYNYNMPSGFAKIVARRGRGLAEHVMTRGRSVVVEDYPAYPRALEEFVNAGVKMVAAAPIMYKGKGMGAIGVFGLSEGKAFGAYDLRLLESIARQASVAIENARLYEKVRSFSRDLERTVEERTAELQVANRRLLELDRLKSIFIASTSHELRTPLNSIIGFSSLMLSDWPKELSAEQKQDVEIIHRAGKQLLALINDIIDISKIEAGKLDSTVEAFGLPDLVKEVVDIVSDDAAARGINISVDVPDIAMTSDRRRMFQCLNNLLLNASKFTEKGSIAVSARREGGEVLLAVADTGIGIKREDLAKLFQPFQRLESPLRPRTSGTGLGLYLVRKIVQDVLGGSVDVASEYGKGSVFTIRVPVVADTKAAAA